jgi:hypothetical protein
MHVVRFVERDANAEAAQSHTATFGPAALD